MSLIQNPIDHVRTCLTPFGVADRIQELPVSTATVALAAEALGCETGRIAKTLSFMANGIPVFLVASGDCRIDNRKYKQRFGCKAKMMTAEELESLTGLHFGGVCPFGLPDAAEVYLDESLKAYGYVYPACGTANSAIRLTLDELEKCSCARGWVDVGKDAEG